MYKLIVCSVDDTLLTNNHTLSEDTKEALLQRAVFILKRYRTAWRNIPGRAVT